MIFYVYAPLLSKHLPNMTNGLPKVQNCVKLLSDQHFMGITYVPYLMMLLLKFDLFSALDPVTPLLWNHLHCFVILSKPINGSVKLKIN